MRRDSNPDVVWFYRDPARPGWADEQYDEHIQALIDRAVLADRAAYWRTGPPAPGPSELDPSAIPWASRVARAVLAELDDPVAVHTVAKALAGMVRAGSVEHFELVERMGRDGGTP